MSYFGRYSDNFFLQNKTFKIENEKVVLINTESPTPRHSFGFTFNTRENCGYLYGGKEYINGQQIPLDDFWRWDGQRWNKIPLTKVKKH